MKTVVQLDSQGYFVGTTSADESPLEPGIYLMPANTIDAELPVAAKDKLSKWDGQKWGYEDIVVPQVAEEEIVELTYSEKRAAEYPSLFDYLDGIVKNDQTQIDNYIAACLAVKYKYPKPDEM